ncbi:MAG TPA: nucleotide exchange factor GrpE [Candidatus Nitrosotalea sp.]|nr:nucleotide exchange factor GrpE [Candidatus Nitrosotalea sp.]
MTDGPESKLPKQPFIAACLAGDALLLGLAWLIFTHSPTPMGRWEIAAYVVCVSLGAWLMVTPFVFEYRALMKVAEADRLRTAVLQIQNLEIIGRQITNATSNWQAAHELSTKNVESARQLGEAVTSGARAFSEFIHKTNDSEKNHLRLEVEKLKRSEGDWLQVLVHIMDHVYAVYYAAARSRQPGLAEQIGNFQNACRDVARRVGLVPFVAAPGEAFNPTAHQLPETNTAPEGARVFETIATGYTYQGKLLRPALVTIGPDPLYAKSDTSHLSVSKINKRRGQIQADDEVVLQIGEHPPDGETANAPEPVAAHDEAASQTTGPSHPSGSPGSEEKVLGS